ncbi:hypothetical protein [Taibaiella koreensis]|uniref:hypothetical protein n=1 Tax=Taibaiella koreensis TaxID=1268548 RepID=UPI000E5999BB|nr:hypothetical protein [Taibaiella koreensis]
MTSFRQEVYEHVQHLLEQKIAAIQQHLDDLREGLKQETKSTAGDKYETGRAMIHIEQENTGRQLNTLLEQRTALEQLREQPAPGTAGPGSLVHTSKGYFFLSIALGKLEVAGHTVYALSPQSPLGSKLTGTAAGTEVVLNGNRYAILSTGS